MNQNNEQTILPSLVKLSDSGALRALAHLIDKHREHKLARFNIFDVLRVTWLELPHSNFLAFLLNPRANHGWGTAFLDLFLKRVCGAFADGKDFAQLDVHREWQYIDILLKDEANHLIVVIENKITSGEGEGQLESYWCNIQKQYSGWTKVFVFLTPGGMAPSHPNYQAVGYDVIVQLLDNPADGPLAHLSSKLNPEDLANVKSAVNQYVQMLRRHIVNDKKVAELSLQIIRENLPTIQHLNKFFAAWQKDMTNKIASHLKMLIKESDHLFADLYHPNYIRFGIAPLHDVPMLNASHYTNRTLWTPSGQLLLFVLHNQPGSLVVELFLYCDHDDIRDKIRPIRSKIEGLAESTPPFHDGIMSGPWLRFYAWTLLTESDYNACDETSLLQRLDESWREFMTGDYLQIEQALRTLLIDQR